MALQLKGPTKSFLTDNLKFDSSETLAFLPNDGTWGDFSITHFKPLE